MPRERIQSKTELSDFVARKYRYYRETFEHTPIYSGVSRNYLKDFCADLLIIQRFANEEENVDDGKERTESVADVS